MNIDLTNVNGARVEDLPEPAWPRHEIIDGSLHVTPMAGVPHQVVVSRLAVALTRIVPPEFEVVMGINVFRRQETDRLLIPDVAVIDRLAAETPGVSIHPEELYLAVEVISPSSRATDLHLKRQLYAEWGVGSYWVLDPVTREVHEFGLRESAASWLADVDLTGIWPA